MSQIRNRGNAIIPTIDFTVHVQDDGTTVRDLPLLPSRAPLARRPPPGARADARVWNGQVSTQERIVKEVQAPAFLRPTDEQFYSDETRTKPDIAFLKNHFYREGRLTDDQVRVASSSGRVEEGGRGGGDEDGWTLRG